MRVSLIPLDEGHMGWYDTHQKIDFSELVLTPIPRAGMNPYKIVEMLKN
jgi:hypothetical protein